MLAQVAVKKVPHRSSKQIRKNFQEIRFLKYCINHPNIIQYIRSTKYEDRMWVITEFIDGVTLSHAVTVHQFTETQIIYVAKNILYALDFLHDNQLAHRDLKSANIMLGVNGAVKLIDFGLCSDISQGEVVHMVGSPFWMPPEMIKRQPHGLLVDIWSYAICLLEMANELPDYKSSFTAMYVTAVRGYPDPSFKKEKWSEDFYNFLICCLNSNQKERWTIKQLLQHKLIINNYTQQQDMAETFKIISNIKE